VNIQRPQTDEHKTRLKPRCFRRTVRASEWWNCCLKPHTTFAILSNQSRRSQRCCKILQRLVQKKKTEERWFHGEVP